MKQPANRPGLTDIYVTRTIGASPGPPDLLAAGSGPCGCARLHRVEWRETFYSENGNTIVCRFRAPDAESVRLALRRAGIPFDSVSTARPPELPVQL